MRPLVLSSAAVILLAASAASCNETPDIGTAAVSRTLVSEVVEAPASVTAKAAATLSSPANGKLVSLSVTPGQKVEIGQTIGVIESPEAQARLDQATTALRAAQGTGGGFPKTNLSGVQKSLDNRAEAAFDEARDAAEQIPDPELKKAALAKIDAAQDSYADVSKSAWQAIRGVEQGLASVGSAMRALTAAQAMQAQQAYDLAKAAVDALTLTAPIAGVVQFGGGATTPSTPDDLSSLLSGVGGGSLPGQATGQQQGVSPHLAIGSPVGSGTAIVTIVDVSELGLVAEVDETDILLVKPGIAADAELDAAPGSALEATVTAIDVLPTANSRGAVAYKVHLLLKPSGIEPRPGMSALVRLKVREASGAVAVPAAAVLRVEGQDIVWVRAPDGTAHKRVITVGVSGRDLLQVTNGLNEGETVVVQGADKIREGDRLP